MNFYFSTNLPCHLHLKLFGPRPLAEDSLVVTCKLCERPILLRIFANHAEKCKKTQCSGSIVDRENGQVVKAKEATRNAKQRKGPRPRGPIVFHALQHFSLEPAVLAGTGNQTVEAIPALVEQAKTIAGRYKTADSGKKTFFARLCFGKKVVNIVEKGRAEKIDQRQRRW